MKTRTEELISEFFTLHGDLLPMREELSRMCGLLLETFRAGGKLLICGNGGSSADSGHIVGELMKGFLLCRPLDAETKDRFEDEFGAEGRAMAEKLQGALPAISLSAHSALESAFCNDVDPALVYAQQVMGYARPGDAVLGISTSGGAVNVCNAMMAAKLCGAKTLALTGRDGGRLAKLSDCALIAPHTETYRIQEYHLAIYHLLCAVVESEQFER